VSLSKRVQDSFGGDGIRRKPSFTEIGGWLANGAGQPEIRPHEEELKGEAINIILDQARSTPYIAVFHFMASTGCRRGEAIGLRWENVDLERGIVFIPDTAQRIGTKGIVIQSTKSAAGRRGIALAQVTVDALREHRGQQLLQQADLGCAYHPIGLVFPGPLGGYLDPSVLTRNFARVAREAGYSGIRLHDLRHGHAAGLVRAGVQPVVIQERMGHASAAFTMQVYGHVSPGLQEQAADAFARQMISSIPLNQHGLLAKC